MKKFEIDFFELSFLAEASIPPRPIARTMFWQSLTDKYWYQMTEGERIHLFEWLQKSWVYEDSLKGETDTKEFHARFNPDNQYMVKTNFLGKEEEHRAFKIGDRYYVKRNTYVSEDHIVSIEKFIPKREY